MCVCALMWSHVYNCFCPPLPSDSPCCMWTATSVWTCRLRRTRWCPPWETATTAAPSSGCSVTWPWASDPSPHLSPHHSRPNRSWLSTPSPGGSHHAHHTPLSVSAQPATTETQTAADYLPLCSRLLLQLATGLRERPHQPFKWQWQAVVLGTSLCQCRGNDVRDLCMENIVITAVTSQPATRLPSTVLLGLLLSRWTND